MVKYESLLLGGKVKLAKRGNGLTYEEKCANLAKGRATRMENLKKKKTGGGNYTQDYVDESQINYLGSPLDMYYEIPEKRKERIMEERGENKGGSLVGLGKNKKKKGKTLLEKEAYETIEEKEEEYPVDLDGALKSLAVLAGKFGLRLVK